MTEKRRYRSSRILVVDDEKVVREVIRNLLDRPGIYIVDAEDGEQAISLILREPFDLLIADKNLPGITGLDVIRRAKAVDRHMGTLLITAFASRESAEEALAIGIDDYIVKPFELSDLENKVEEAIERRSQRLKQDRTAATTYSLHQRPKKKRIESRRVLVCHPSAPTRRILFEGMEILGHNPVLATGMSKVLAAVRNKDAEALICDLELLNQDNATSCFLRSTLLVTPDLRFVAVARERGLDGAVEAIHHGAGKVIYMPLGDGKEVADILRRYLGDASRK